MSEQTKSQKPSIIGEDGELIQPDTTVNPDVYTEYLATHVHRDPMVFGLREHIREYGCAYLLFSPLMLVLIFILPAMFIKWIEDVYSDFGQDVTLLVIEGVTLILGIGIGYFVIEARRYYRS